MDRTPDSTSDLDEELPVFDFLQTSQRSCQDSRRSPKKPVRTSDGEFPAISSEMRGAGSEVLMISSDSEDEAPYVSLAQRIKRRQDGVIDSSSPVPHKKHAELYLPSNPASSLARVGTPRQDAEDLPLRPLSFPDTAPGTRRGTESTAEDLWASREKDMRRRAKERQQQDKKALLQERERAKEERKALAEAAKALRPEECIKHMVVSVDPAHLQQDGGGTLLASLQALGCSCAIEKQPFPRGVSWTRRAPGSQLEDAACAPEPHVLLQMKVEDFLALIHNYIQEERRGRTDSGPTLTSWVQQLQRRHPSKILSLAVIELDKHFRIQKSQNQKRLREAVAGEEGGRRKEKKKRRNGDVQELPQASRLDVEEAVVNLQLHTGVSVHFFSTWKEFIDYVTMTTRAIAEAPFKREREQTGFSFYLESEWAGGQRVEKTGRGLTEVWRRQLQQLNRVSKDTAAAILAAYPSPQLLRKAYSRCRTMAEKVSLLSDLLVRRGEGITSTTQRVGPELSKRLYLLMHSSDPELTLDSSL